MEPAPNRARRDVGRSGGELDRHALRRAERQVGLGLLRELRRAAGHARILAAHDRAGLGQCSGMSPRDASRKRLTSGRWNRHPATRWTRCWTCSLPFAQQQLEKHGEFFPFAASIDSSGAQAMVAVDLGDDTRRQPT